jgi:hypothetical protein
VKIKAVSLPEKCENQSCLFIKKNVEIKPVSLPKNVKLKAVSLPENVKIKAVLSLPEKCENQSCSLQEENLKRSYLSNKTGNVRIT